MSDNKRTASKRARGASPPSTSTSVSQIRINGLKGVVFDTCPGGLFYPANTFGRGTFLVRSTISKIIIADDGDANTTGNIRRIERIPEMLLLPGIDGGVLPAHDASYNVVTLAVRRKAPAANINEIKSEGVTAMKIEAE
eukprot:GDKK01077901.1.p1 GENE.GDKK01077901.1~~GDKK01077901.1.p1  ORF type:complete len:139 (+),score=6.00 GDKK01077901.1:67-483(+)